MKVKKPIILNQLRSCLFQGISLKISTEQMEYYCFTENQISLKFLNSGLSRIFQKTSI